MSWVQPGAVGIGTIGIRRACAFEPPSNVQRGGVIYQMIKACKAIGDNILDDVTMAFFPGAKIGMVGPNGG